MIGRRRARKLAVPISLGILLAILYTWSSIRDASRPLSQKKLRPTKVDNSKNHSYPTAVLAFQTYQEQHSQEALILGYNENETSLQDRKYAVAYYWCPQRMGNIMHSFFNTIAWAMIHNRTVLWKYHHTEHVSTEVECQTILKRASWLPSFDEWHTLLHEQPVIPVDLDISTDFNLTQSYPIVLYPQIPDVLAENTEVIRSGWIEDPSHPKYQAYLKSLPQAFQMVQNKLYSEGKEFLYGMLYSEIFTVEIPVKKEVFGYNHTRKTDSKSFSIALHSRHTVGADDGSYINQETKCLNALLSLSDDDSTKCEVHIMSDRPKTVDLLIAWLLERNCTAIIANHTVGPRINDIPEHGPWSGAGFLLDLQVVGEAQNGVVGDQRRSSTALVIYSVEYNRRMAALERGEELLQEELPLCQLPSKALSGYNYGPGSPTFRHHSHLDPLQPIGLMDMYKKEHGHVTPGQKRYIVSYFDYEKASPEAVYDVLNSFLYSIISNRTFVLLGDCGRPCVKDKYSLVAKAWLDNISSAVKYDVSNSTISKLHLDNETLQASMVNEKILQLQFDQQHYNLSEWTDMMPTEQSNQLTTLEQMFARGGPFLYGLLFHEAFDILQRIDPPWHEPPTTSIVIDFESDLRSGEIEKCLDSMLPEPLRFTPEAEHCHVFLLTAAQQPNDTNVNFIDPKCSFSFVHLAISSSTDGNWWRRIDLASRARSGWIAPFNSSLTPAVPSFIKERMEYYRHRETWILGRDPFFITNLHECYYQGSTE